MEFSHISVLLQECMDALEPERGGIYVDCTAGGGGHSFEIAKRLPKGSRLISIDQDDEAIEACKKRLAPYSDVSTVVKANFSQLTYVLDSLQITHIDGILWDLGVSSVQLDEPERGFSYSYEAPLDMRMDRCGGRTASDIVNGYTEEELRRIIKDYGEENFAHKIANAIVHAREKAPLKTTTELAEIVAGAIPAPARRKEAQHPARRTFQAIRIEVNGELEVIKPSILSAVDRLNPGGRAAVITFHSLEDRIVKQIFAKLVKPCECPPDFPVCICGKKPEIRLIYKKPVTPSASELKENPRSRSAKLRCAEKL